MTYLDDKDYSCIITDVREFSLQQFEIIKHRENS